MPAGHIVHFILDAVEQLPITDFRVNERGSGSEQYPPRMMLALLIYCYATGRFGSRTIEAANCGTGLRHHQRGDGLPALQLKGPCKSLTGVDPGLREL